ncbi:SHOCT domain-containing protein [Actinoplanes sp. NPDC049548]|uniref:SHOCT domain-containing protein n=1 Tax=Actinoplanes sp. NPDC049548 TaxID=3155152 RepID=UPI00342028D5
MMYYGSGMGAGGWVLMILTVALLAALVFVLVRPLAGRTVEPPASPDPTADAERVLADRLARGDIDTDEYQRRLQTLRAERRQ